MTACARIIAAAPAQTPVGALGSRRVIRRAPATSLQPKMPRGLSQQTRTLLVVRAQENDVEEAEMSEAGKKAVEIARLRAAEKFAKIGSGKAICQGCGFTYDPTKGDPEYPVSAGTQFQQLPEDWGCPTCGAPKKLFALDVKEVSGFAENQGYGLGTNAMTGEEKSRLIYGSLLFFFMLFLSGYFLN